MSMQLREALEAIRIALDNGLDFAREDLQRVKVADPRERKVAAASNLVNEAEAGIAALAALSAPAEQAQAGWIEKRLDDLRDCYAARGYPASEEALLFAAISDARNAILGAAAPSAPTAVQPAAQVQEAGGVDELWRSIQDRSISENLVPHRAFAEAILARAAQPATPVAPARNRERYIKDLEDTMNTLSIILGSSANDADALIASARVARDALIASGQWEHPSNKGATPVAPVDGRHVIVCAGALQMVRNALKRDADEGRTARGEMLQELDAATHPVPPVAPIKLNAATRDQIAAVMLQCGTPQQQEEALAYASGAPVAPKTLEALTDDDSYALIGQAQLGLSEGKLDMPAFFLDLAARLFEARGEPAAAERTRAIATKNGMTMGGGDD